MDRRRLTHRLIMCLARLGPLGALGGNAVLEHLPGIQDPRTSAIDREFWAIVERNYVIHPPLY